MDRKAEEATNGSAIRDDENKPSRRLGRAGGKSHLANGDTRRPKRTTAAARPYLSGVIRLHRNVIDSNAA